MLQILKSTNNDGKDGARDGSGYLSEQGFRFIVVDGRVVDLNRHPFEHQTLDQAIDDKWQVLKQRRQSPKIVAIRRTDE